MPNSRSAREEHEKAICATALALWNKRLQSRYRLLSRPDKTERRKPAVDFLAGLGNPLLAIEHTLLESYLEQTGDGHLFYSILEPVRDQLLRASLPKPGRYSLLIRCGKAALIRGKNKKKIQDEIYQWAIATAPTLQIGNPPLHMRAEKLSGVPFEIFLTRFKAFSEVDDGTIVLARFGPEDLEKQRCARMSQALQDKCPKLLAAKESDLHSFLILESADTALADAHVIGRAFVIEGRERKDMPDYVYLIEGGIKWVLKEKEKWYPDIPNYGPHF